MDEELKSFWRHHDNAPPDMGTGNKDINARDGAKGWDGKPIKREGVS